MIKSCADCQSNDRFIFSDLEPEFFDELQAGSTTHRLASGETVVAPGSPALAVFCIMSGAIKMSRIGERGDRQILRLLGPTDVLGLQAILSGNDYAVSATVMAPATVCVVPRALVLDVIERSSRFAFRVMKYLAHENRRTEDILMALTQRPVRRRIADLLLLLNGHAVLGDDWEPFRVHDLQRREIAQAVGATPETVSRVLAEFAEMGLIAVSRREIKLLDLEGLQTVASEKVSAN